MADSTHGKGGMLARIRLWLRSEIIAEVPPEIAACEFQCRVHQCMRDQWETCENRLRVARGCEE